MPEIPYLDALERKEDVLGLFFCVLKFYFFFRIFKCYLISFRFVDVFEVFKVSFRCLCVVWGCGSGYDMSFSPTARWFPRKTCS